MSVIVTHFEVKLFETLKKSHARTKKKLIHLIAIRSRNKISRKSIKAHQEKQAIMIK